MRKNTHNGILRWIVRKILEKPSQKRVAAAKLLIAQHGYLTREISPQMYQADSFKPMNGWELIHLSKRLEGRRHPDWVHAQRA